MGIGRQPNLNQPDRLWFESGEDLLDVLTAKHACQDVDQRGPIIAGDLQASRTEQLFSLRAKIGFGPVNLSPVDLRADRHQREAAPVIGAERAVFVNSATEF